MNTPTPPFSTATSAPGGVAAMKASLSKAYRRHSPPGGLQGAAPRLGPPQQRYDLR